MAIAKPVAGTVSIRYIGKKESHEDTVASTGIVWKPGMVKPVTREQAAILLAYPDCWEDARAESVRAKDTIKPVRPSDRRYTETDERDYPPLVNLKALDKTGLQQYSIRHLGKKLDEDMSEDAMREAVNRGTEAKMRFEYA